MKDQKAWKNEVAKENQLLSNHCIASWSWDLVTGKIIYSPFFKYLLGYTEEEFPDTLDSLEKNLHPEDKDKIFALSKRDPGPYVVESRLRCKNGENTWFQFSGAVDADAQGNPNRVAGSIADIDIHKKAQQRLAAQYEITRIMSENHYSQGIYVKILQAMCEKLNWQFASMWMINTEDDRLQCIGLWHKDLTQMKEFEHMTRSIHFERGQGLPGRVWSLEKPVWVENVVIDKNFPRAPFAKKAQLHAAFAFPILLENKIIGVIEIFTHKFLPPDEELLKTMGAIGPQIGQFIKRKKAENELTASETYLKAVLDSALDCIITINSTGTILSLNPHTEILFKCLKEELIHKNLSDFIPDLMVQLPEFKSNVTKELMAIPKHGLPIPVEITLSEMHVNNQDLCVCIVRDITERKKIEKMKTEFISIVSHELRTPLTSIKGSLGLLLGKFGDAFAEQPKKLLEIAKNNCDRLIRLINDILDIEKIEHGKMEFKFNKLNLRQLLIDAVEANMEFANKFNVTLKLNCETDAFISGDYDRLMQVITNLLSNAIKFSYEKGEVIVGIKFLDETIRVFVEDHGKGIPGQFQSKVFSKFAQADSSASRGVSGTGLGLNICKAIVESHHGTIGFDTEEGHGATFYFDLPILKEEDQLISTLPSQTLTPLDGTIGRILICEDDKDFAYLLRVILEDKGFSVDIAYNQYEAKKFLSKNQYAAMTLDLMLPDQNSIELLKELQTDETFKKLPIIVISAIAKQGADELKGSAIQVMGWLDKPVNEDIFLKLIDDIKEKTSKERLTILNVEDNPDILAVTSSLLADSNLRIFSARSIAEAKEWLAKEDFDLVILDLKLPDGSGADILPCINWKTKRIIPVVVFSAYELEKEYTKYVSATLMKSTTSNEKFIETIHQAIHQRLT